LDAIDAIYALDVLEANECRGFYECMNAINLIDAMFGMDVLNAMDAMYAMDIILVDAWMSRMSWMIAYRQICRLTNTRVLNKLSKNIL
jgi:hypothetical protein